jgi:Rps23 Pro-64 3,4-dihydroxylase Tpa1-like proline 4-hydroxylase
MTGLQDFQGTSSVSTARRVRAMSTAWWARTRHLGALYLNDDWAASDGGELRMYTGGGASEDVLPRGGRLVAFLSDRFEHEVLPSSRERLSFTGWYRRRPLEGFV